MPQSNKLWPVKNILDERGVGRRIEYLLEWEGVDPKTGKPWEPSWQPKTNANAVLIRTWEQEKAARKRRMSGSREAGSPDVTMEPPEPEATPISAEVTKIGPPRGVKRKRAAANGSGTVPAHTGEGSSHAAIAPGKDQSPTASQSGTSADNVLPTFPEDEYDPTVHPQVPPTSTPLGRHGSHGSVSTPSVVAKMKARARSISSDPKPSKTLPSLVQRRRSRDGVTQTLFSLPKVSPSTFKRLQAQAASQEAIEEFSSPEQGSRGIKSRRQDNISSVINATTQDASAGLQDHVIVQEMEDAYVDFDPQLEQNSSVQHTQTVQTSAPFPSTSSTQQADVDSQSQEFIQQSKLPTAINPALVEVLQEKDNLIAELKKQCSTQEGLIASLTAENIELEKKHVILSGAAENQNQQLGVLQAHIQELEEALETTRTAGVDLVKSTYEGHIKKLQSEVDQLKGMHHILSTKDQRTDDEVRRRAANEPELQAKNLELEKELEQAEEDIIKLQFEVKHLQSLLVDAQQPFYVCQYVEAGTHCHAKFSDDLAVHIHVYEVHYPYLKGFEAI